MNDRELIREVRDGSAVAFKELVDRYKNLVVNTCYGFVRNYDDAQDLAQDVFIEVHKSGDRFRGQAKPSTWLYRIAVNKSLNFIKAKKRRKWIQSFHAVFAQETQQEDLA